MSGKEVCIYESKNFKYIRNKLFLNDSTTFSPINYNNTNTIFFPMEDKKEEVKIKVKNVNLKGIYKSASITFYSKTNGYLLCEEVRDNKLVYHPIGGKYEEFDKNIENTASREFIEETGILQNKDFIDFINKGDHFSNIKEKAIDYIYHILINNEITDYYDYYVNIEKEYIHKYYVIHIDKLEYDFKNIIKNMDSFYESTFKELRNNDEYIVSLYWDKEIMKNNLNRKRYSMLTIYLSNLLKK